MKVTAPCVVALTWTLKDTLGDTLDQLDEPVECLVGGDDLLETIEQALEGRSAGEQLELHLEPEQAFGDYDEQLLFLEPRSAFPAELDVGMVFEGMPPGCSAHAPANRLFFVSEIYPEHVVMDGNHPLSGMALRVSMRLHHVRAANAEEVSQGTLGPGFFKLHH